mmetsp:Transcript_22334/g.61746  ORF Transcript_22334/g.61746 Transcript_22334/m.61746 type:complete len:236 (-) Transcript_22334:732-1439(-)
MGLHAASEVIHQPASFILHLNDLTSPHIHQAVLLRCIWLPAALKHLSHLGATRWPDGEQEQHVMQLELVPLRTDVAPQVPCVNDNVGSHGCRLELPHGRLAHLSDLEHVQRQRHARPARKLDHWHIPAVVPVSTHTAQRVSQVLADGIRCLKPEQVEVSEQVVVGGEELEVQFGKGQAALACVVDAGDLVLIPQHTLCGVQRHLVDDLALRPPPLIRGQHDLLQKGLGCNPGVSL